MSVLQNGDDDNEISIDRLDGVETFRVDVSGNTSSGAGMGMARPFCWCTGFRARVSCGGMWRHSSRRITR